MTDFAAARPPSWTRRIGRHWVQYRTAYLFVLPAFLLYALFMIYPFVQSIHLSFTSWNGADPVKPRVGLANYQEIVHDEQLWRALKHNLIWVVVGTISPMVIGLFLAMLLWKRPFGFTAFRTSIFMPQVLSSVVIAFIWGWIYNPIFGLLNKIARPIGLDSVSRGWLGDPRIALYAVLARRSGRRPGSSSSSFSPDCKTSARICWKRRPSTGQLPGSASGTSPCRNSRMSSRSSARCC